MQRCARPPEIHSAIMSAREFWCRRRIRSTDIIIIVMHRSVPIILSEHSVNWTVRWEDIKKYLLGGEEVRFDAFVDQQYDRLLMMRRELDRKIHTIAGTRKILDQIRIADVGKPVIRKWNILYI